MYLHMYGKDKWDKIVLLHPFGSSGDQIYQKLGKKFQGDYCFISPDMGNHGSEKRTFISVQEEANMLHQFLVQQKYTKIRFLYGASLGAACALRLLAYQDLSFEQVYLDGAPVAKLDFMKRSFFTTALLMTKTKILDDRKKGMQKFVKSYGEEMAEQLADFFEQLEDDSLRNLRKSCAGGNTIFLNPIQQKKVYFEWGDQDIFCKNSYALVQKKYPEAKAIIREGYGHCEYLAWHFEDYATGIEQILQGQ